MHQNKLKIPLIGLGTYNLLGHQCVKIIKEALAIGYRHIDTAHAYENHHAVGEGIKGFDRDKLFITSKIALEQIDDKKIFDSVEKACDKVLKELRLEYLDLYLIHWPDRKRPMIEILKAMNGLIQAGKVRHAGVSNYTIHHLQDALDAKLSVAANQVEFHPYLYQKQLLEFCNQHGVQLIAYRPLGKGELLKVEPLFAQIGEKYGKTGGQIVLRWCVQKQISVIPKASSKKHLEENFNIFDFSLSDQDMKALDHLNKNKRYCDPDWEEFNY